MPAILKPSFAGGEIAPALHARVDLSKYQTGLALARNFFVQAHGGVSNRAGLRLVGEAIGDAVLGTSDGRLIPFQFNTTDTYVLLFQPLTMRVIRNGAFVLEAAASISAITQATPGVVTTSAAHGYSNGQEVYLSGLGGMTALNGRNVIVRNVTSTTFTMEDRNGSAISTASLPAYTSGGSVARIYQISTPYAAADLPLLKFVQSADTMTITVPSAQPRTLRRSAHNSWQLVVLNFVPDIAQPSAPTVTPNTTGTTTYRYKVVAVSTSGEQSDPSPATTITNGNATANNTVTWTSVSGAASYNVYKEGSGLYGFIGRATGLSFLDNNIKPDETDTPIILSQPFITANNYPGCVAYHEDRIVYGRTNAELQTLWFSQPAAYGNFSSSIPTKDDDAIKIALLSRQVNEIRHIVSVGDLLVLTSGGEWVVKAGQQSDVITPASISAKAQSARGSSHIAPIVVGTMVLYIQERGQIVRDLGYQFEVDNYTGNDLTLLSRHLFEGRTIREWGYAQAPYSLIWCVMEDGALLSLTYLREHEVWAWCRHDTAGEFRSVTVISEGGEDVAYFCVRRTINGQSRVFVERMASRLVLDVQDSFFVDCGLSLDNPVGVQSVGRLSTATVTVAPGHGCVVGDLVDISGVLAINPAYPATSDKWEVAHPVNGRWRVLSVVDTSTITIGDPVTGVPVNGTAWPAHVNSSPVYAFAQQGKLRRAVSVVGGLHHLEGQQVAVLANGDVQPTATVTNGQVSLTRPASRIHVGLPYTSDMQTLRIDAAGELQGRKKAIPYVTIRMEATRGLAGGPREGTLYELKQGPVAYDTPTGLLTGDYRLSVPGDWGTGGQLFFRQSYPLPATIVGLIPEVVLGQH
jgi:hypothetical protein